MQNKLGAIALSTTLLFGTLTPTDVAVIGVGSVAAITLAGCTPTQIENEINTIVQEGANIVAVADPGTLPANFAQYVALLKADEANWIKGGAVQDIINVLNDLEGVTALIGPLVPYAQLIGVLVAGIDAVLALLLPPPSTGTAASPAVMSVHEAQAKNPFKGMTTVKNVKDSVKQWNFIVASNPSLSKARI